MTSSTSAAHGSSVHFPGAVDSKFVSKMEFVRPSMHSTIPTYRVMDSNGVIVDTGKKPSDVSTDEIISWYKNMVSGMTSNKSLKDGLTGI